MAKKRNMLQGEATRMQKLVDDVFFMLINLAVREEARAINVESGMKRFLLLRLRY